MKLLTRSTAIFIGAFALTIGFLKQPQPFCRKLNSLTNEQSDKAPLSSKRVLNCRIESQLYENFTMKSLVMSNIDIVQSSFARAVLSESSWITLRADKANFSKLSAKSLQVTRSNLNGSSFRDADLRGMKMDHTSCENCDFRGADLSAAVVILSSLKDSYYDHRTVLPFSERTARALGMRKVDAEEQREETHE